LAKRRALGWLEPAQTPKKLEPGETPPAPAKLTGGGSQKKAMTWCLRTRPRRGRSPRAPDTRRLTHQVVVPGSHRPTAAPPRPGFPCRAGTSGASGRRGIYISSIDRYSYPPAQHPRPPATGPHPGCHVVKFLVGKVGSVSQLRFADCCGGRKTRMRARPSTGVCSAQRINHPSHPACNSIRAPEPTRCPTATRVQQKAPPLDRK